MSRHETRNVFYANGPGFKQSSAVATPTGNVDIAPTVLHLLHLPGGETMHGRILHEILANGPDSVERQTVTHEAERITPSGSYRQAITVSRVGETVYVDEGSGGLQPG